MSSNSFLPPQYARGYVIYQFDHVVVDDEPVEHVLVFTAQDGVLAVLFDMTFDNLSSELLDYVDEVAEQVREDLL